MNRLVELSDHARHRYGAGRYGEAASLIECEKTWIVVPGRGERGDELSISAVSCYIESGPESLYRKVRARGFLISRGEQVTGPLRKAADADPTLVTQGVR